MSIVNKIVTQSWQAFTTFKQSTVKQRYQLLYAIADELAAQSSTLIATCMSETNLTEARLTGELGRTQFQLRSYADACLKGDWLQAIIDTAMPDKAPPKADIRKLMVPIGPVAVFGASNFPFAYSTAGGDTASALAAGCTVVVKTHNAHFKTSALVANVIQTAIEKCGLSPHIFQTIETEDLTVAQDLVKHDLIKAVGFTGSLKGGTAIWKIANERPTPIPVFAEMSSINPVFLLTEKLQNENAAIAHALAGSITLGAGQFCTNPGLIVGLESESLTEFIQTLGEKITGSATQPMLHADIAKNYRTKVAELLADDATTLVGQAAETDDVTDFPTVATTSAADFLKNRNLHQEVFGSFSLVVICKDSNELNAVTEALDGQLTISFWATQNDLISFKHAVDTAQFKCGRIIFNNVPTGVEVVLGMQHGGPWPASTDSRFGSVGANAINRFTRPLCFQNWPQTLLPIPLQNANPDGIWRTVNNELSKDAIA